MKYFTSDWHLSHSGIIKLANRPFEDTDKMDSVILSNILSQVNKKDEIFFLGDLAWRPTALLDKFFNTLEEKRIQFHWIIGNHDRKVLSYYRKFAASISEIKETKINKHNIIMCHYPLQIWRNGFRNSYHLFGHLHKNSIEYQRGLEFRGKMLNVNLEFKNYLMYNENEIMTIMKNKENNLDYIENENG